MAVMSILRRSFLVQFLIEYIKKFPKVTWALGNYVHKIINLQSVIYFTNLFLPLMM